jgi:hypothetical protein
MRAVIPALLLPWLACLGGPVLAQPQPAAAPKPPEHRAKEWRDRPYAVAVPHRPGHRAVPPTHAFTPRHRPQPSTLLLDSTCFAILFLAKATAAAPVTGG